MGKQKSIGPDDDLEELYLDFLRFFYADENIPESRRIAKKIEMQLAQRFDLAGSIRGDELRSLIADLNGDIESAIKHRHNEIRRIFELHSLTKGTPGWDYVFKKYNYSDIGDRIELLADLYARSGDFDHAINLLYESQTYCASHDLVFDAKDMLDDLHERRQTRSKVSAETSIDWKIVDESIVETYKSFNRSSDQILVDETLSSQFVAEVLRRLLADMQVSLKLVKSRLLTLRRRGEARGGLPRLRRHA